MHAVELREGKDHPRELGNDPNKLLYEKTGALLLRLTKALHVTGQGCDS